MDERLISKQEFNELMNVKGEVRGFSILEDADVMEKLEGKEALKKIEDAITNLGYDFKYKNIKKMDFYPIGLEGIHLLTIKRLFDYDDEKFKKMGAMQVKVSLMIRLFMKYLFSVESALKVVARMWSTYYTVGNFKVAEFNKRENYAVLRLENYSLHPIHCQNILGYLPGMAEIIVGKKVSCQETKCTHRGDEYHEFLLKW